MYKKMKIENLNSRRKFIGTIAAGATAGIAAVSHPLVAKANFNTQLTNEDEAWFKKTKAKHRIVYDASEPHDGFPIIWSWVYYKSNNQTGVTDKDAVAMVVLRHNAIPFAMEDRLWEKYQFGKHFGINDNGTKAAAIRNPYYIPKEGDFPLPGIDGIKALQDRGAMFCVCDMALTVYSSMISKEMDLDPEEAKKDWVAGVHPGIKIVPSGVWAISRAQENGFGYCYAGG
jgi:intracellular sulfur oxidation DsrE/DsrF family protein